MWEPRFAEARLQFTGKTYRVRQSKFFGNKPGGRGAFDIGGAVS